MNVLILSRRLHPSLLIGLFLLIAGPQARAADEKVGVTEIAPGLLVFATSAGNVIASVGRDGVLLVGLPSAGSTEQISNILATRTKSPVRYVVIAAEDVAHSEGDAGWGRRGAFVAMQENALNRLGGHVMGAPQPLPPELGKLGVERPRVSFSEVIAFDLNGEAIHIVHQPAGYSDADFLAHFHLGKLVYMGEDFPGDGYPRIDPAQGGTLEGLLKTTESWTDSAFKVVPARGKVTDGGALKKFRDMMVAVRDRIKPMVAAGKTEDEVVTARPTSEFDAQWGHGRVQPEQFVRDIYRSLKGQ
jgi:cyclase